MARSQVRAVNVAEAKKTLSELLGRVAFGGESVIITRRGRPMARLVPHRVADAHGLGAVRGWLDDADPFFSAVDAIVAARGAHRPRSAVRRRPSR